MKFQILLYFCNRNYKNFSIYPMKGLRNALFDSEFLIGWQIYPGIGVGESSQSLTPAIFYAGKRVFSACLFPFWALFLIFFDKTGLFFKRNFKICFTFVTEITKISVATQWKTRKTLFLIANFLIGSQIYPGIGVGESSQSLISTIFYAGKRVFLSVPVSLMSYFGDRDSWLVVDHFCDP